MARLVGYAAAQPKRRLGSMAGQFRVPDDFDTLGAEEIERFFEGEPQP